MKRGCLLLYLMLYVLFGFSQAVFINELHYDNAGTDENEGLEIAAPAGTDLTCYEIHLYNGNNGLNYEPVVPLEGTIEDQDNGFGTHWVAIEGIQNGDNDAIALYNTCTEIVELFISYEGKMSAADGVAKDMISDDIGVAEINTEAGTSLQLIGSGMVYTDFIWSEATASTYGSINTNQTFGEATIMPNFNVTPAELLTSESTDSVVYTLQATNLYGRYEVNIDVKPEATAAENEDYTIRTHLLVIDAANGTNQTRDIVIYVLNDEVEEETESAEFQISVAGEVFNIENGDFALTIEDDDAPPPTLNMYTIEEIHTENENGVADSLDVKCELSGIVYGVNLWGDSGLLFTINDGTGGISVFNSSNNFDYEVSQGDEIKVQGAIGQYNGLTQIEADTLWKVSEGNALNEPSVFFDTGLYEALESEYITMDALTIIDPAEWEGDGGNFNVRFITSTILIDVPAPDTVIVRIDNNTDLASLSLEEVTGGVTENYEMLTWSITGIGGQFDNSEPYTSGYQLFPFGINDIEVVEGTSTPNYIIENDIKIFPNPIKDDWLEVHSVTKINGLRLYNSNGLLLNESNNNTMNLKEISRGFYLLEVETNRGKALKKIIR